MVDASKFAMVNQGSGIIEAGVDNETFTVESTSASTSANPLDIEEGLLTFSI